MTEQTHCDRCKESLNNIRIMSWFTTEIICMPCKDKETKVKELLPNKGEYFEGCGFVPISYITKFHPDAPPSHITLDIEIE